MARSTALAEARSVNTAPTMADLYRHFDLYVPNMLAWLGDRFDIDDDGCWIWRGTPIRPEDIYAGTHRDRVRQSVAKGRHRNQNTGRKTCKNGHPLEGDNVRRIGSAGFRRCITCQREYQRQWRALNR